VKHRSLALGLALLISALLPTHASAHMAPGFIGHAAPGVMLTPFTPPANFQCVPIRFAFPTRVHNATNTDREIKVTDRGTLHSEGATAYLYRSRTWLSPADSTTTKWVHGRACANHLNWQTSSAAPKKTSFGATRVIHIHIVK